MGYIKKLKNNELVGGTDKHTIYPVTSTKAVFEEVTEGDKSSFKSQETINGEHDDRIKGLENEMPDTVKSITINGGTKKYTVDDEGNVELTIYSEGGEDYPGIAEIVQNNADNITAIQNEIGTDTTEDTLSGRIKSLENAVGTGGSVDQRISNAIGNINAEHSDMDPTDHIQYQIVQSNGEITDLTIQGVDIASADALEALRQTYEGLSRTDIIIQDTTPTTGDEGVIYRVTGETTYTDYMFYNDQRYTMATYDIGNLDPQVSYYTCATSADTPAKVATGTDAAAYALTLGGHFKVEMDEANTATSGVTLQVGSAAAKELMYNGASVNQDNTWEDGEVIAVYYYNNKYWASNAQGGGGKAEKIKYDNSQSGLSAENVQGALDEVGDTLFELSDKKAIAMGSSIKYYYTYENGVIGTTEYSTYRLFQPVDISDYYALFIKFYLPERFPGKSFFTNANDVMVGDFLVNEEYEEKMYVVPEGATKLYFSVYYNNNTDVSVKGVTRKSLDERVEQLEEGLKDTNENTVLDKVTFYNPYSSTQYGYVKEDGTIATGSSSSPYRYTGYIDVEEDNVIYIHANFVVTAVAVLAAYDSENTFIQGSSIMADGSGSQDIIYKVPAGVSYLRLSASTSDNTWKAEKGISVKNVLADGLHGVIEYTPEHGAGDAYLQLDGTYVADGHHNWKITYPFNVLEGDEVFFQTTNNASTGMVGAYTDESLMVASSVVAGSDQNSKMWYKYTVPQGVKWIRISHKYSVDGDITVYIRRKIEKMPKKSISVLFIGNSITQDTVTYVPLLLRELAPELDFHFYIWYNGGFTLDQHLAYFNNDTPCSIFSRCSNSPSWKNFTDSVTMSSILSTYTFDIVQIQEYCHYKDTAELVEASVETFNDVIEYIEDHYDKPFKVATLYHKTLLDHDNLATAPQVFERTRAIISRYLKDTVTELLNPAGISMYRAMAVPELDELGDQGHLSPDARHAQEGLPCMMEAYVTAMWLLNILGIPMSVVNSRTVVNNNNYEGIGVPGANLGTGVVIGTEEQVRLSQLVAVKALKEGEYIRNKELTEYTT